MTSPFMSTSPCPTPLFRRPTVANIQDAETSAKSSADRDQEIATGNPLLNLQNALGQSPARSATSSATASFSVKRRWDDDLIFKNQAAGLDDKPKKGEFVNDLLRSEFHKKFMLK
jgi:protein CWC15